MRHAAILLPGAAGPDPAHRGFKPASKSKWGKGAMYRRNLVQQQFPLSPKTSIEWSEVGKRRTSVGWDELFKLKQLFGVSVQALTYRCKDLGIFNQVLFRRLFDEFKRRGWRDPPCEEPLAIREGEKPRRFERLCLRALAEGAISEPKAAELLGVPVREMDRRMREPPESGAA